MNEKSKNKREWVKTAAIIFLSVMLVLTFFSNTFMNYSLPEVATTYVQSGTITAKIRGNGVVESGDPYQIVAEESRKVLSVAVRAGDVVQKGDVLLYLEDSDSEELKSAKSALEAAKKALDQAQEAYDRELLNSSYTASDIQQAQGNVSVENYRKRINEVQQEIKKAQADAEQFKIQVTQLTQAISDCNQQSKYEETQRGILAEDEKKWTAAQAELTAAQAELETAQADQAAAPAELEQAEANLNAAQAELEQAKAELEQADAEQKKDAENKVAEAEAKVTAAQARVTAAENKVAGAPQKVEEARAAVTAAQARVAAVQEAHDKYVRHGQTIQNLTSAVSNYDLQLYNVQKNLAAAEAVVTQKNEELIEIGKTIGNVTTLETKLDDISEARKVVKECEAEVQKQEEKAKGATVNAEISGTVSSINVSAGQTFQYKDTLVVLQPEGQGCTMSFTVTNEQARRLSVGDKADLVNAWRYDDVEVTLASIKPDKTNPGQNKLLTFNVTGSIVAGQTLNISVGQKSANYDLIVPNSAIREDSNGKFILIVESKSSPLGNRYVASRVDVEVIASDDTRSAVSGALYGYEYVITTSTKPVEAGKLVRLADN